MCADTAKFRHAAVARLALEAAFDAVDRVDQDSVADTPSFYLGADFSDFAGNVQAGMTGRLSLIPGMPRRVKTS